MEDDSDFVDNLINLQNFIGMHFICVFGGCFLVTLLDLL